MLINKEGRGGYITRCSGSGGEPQKYRQNEKRVFYKLLRVMRCKLTGLKITGFMCGKVNLYLFTDKPA